MSLFCACHLFVVVVVVGRSFAWQAYVLDESLDSDPRPRKTLKDIEVRHEPLDRDELIGQQTGSYLLERREECRLWAGAPVFRLTLKGCN